MRSMQKQLHWWWTHLSEEVLKPELKYQKWTRSIFNDKEKFSIVWVIVKHRCSRDVFLRDSSIRPPMTICMADNFLPQYKLTLRLFRLDLIFCFWFVEKNRFNYKLLQSLRSLSPAYTRGGGGAIFGSAYIQRFMVCIYSCSSEMSDILQHLVKHLV
jgi:hypothetical protein